MTAHSIPSAAVAIRPYLLQFLQSKEKLAPDEPLVLPGNSIASLYLTSLLTPATIFTLPNMDYDPPVAATGRLNYVVTPSMEERGQFFLSKMATARFNVFLRRWMESTLFERVDTLTALGVKEKDVIEGFMSEFGLEMEFDTLKKACTRHRERSGLMPLKVRYNGRPNREGGADLCQPCTYYSISNG